MGADLIYLFENSAEFFCLLNTDGEIVQTNPAFRKILNYTTEELAGKLNNFFHPADATRWEQLLKNLKTTKTAHSEIRVKAKDGRYYNVKWLFVDDETDNMIYATGVNLTHDAGYYDLDFVANNILHIVQSFNEGFFIVNDNWKILTFNPAFQAITGLCAEDLPNTDLREIKNLGLTEDAITGFETAFHGSISAKFAYLNKHLNRWTRVSIYPHNNELTVFMRDITRMKTQQLILALEKRILELNASGQYTLQQTVTKLLEGIEDIYPDMICSVLEIDDAQEKIYHLAAPRLPKTYCEAIDGTGISPKSGSCGTAAYHRHQIIVTDIANDPLWDDYRDFLGNSEIKACWSTPIISSNSAQVLATFAVYYTESRAPKDEELQLIERTTNILRVLIENKRNRDHVHNQNKRLQEIASISSHEIRRPVATILGLVSLFDKNDMENPLNRDIIKHLNSTAKELDAVIHTIVEKTIFLDKNGSDK